MQKIVVNSPNQVMLNYGGSVNPPKAMKNVQDFDFERAGSGDPKMVSPKSPITYVQKKMHLKPKLLPKDVFNK